jgi:hypothetical protein
LQPLLSNCHKNEGQKREDSDKDSVCVDGSEGDKDDGIDSEREFRSELNSAANEISQTGSVSPPTPNSGPNEVELEPQHRTITKIVNFY